MKQQYLRLYSFLIGITFIISGIVYTFVNDYKAYKKKQLEEEIVISEKIAEVYKGFYDKETELNEFREEYVEDVASFTSYFENMPKNYKTVVGKIEKYEKQLVEIDNSTEYLKEVCNKRYSVSDANDKCDAFYINLEKSINLFIGDVEFLNSKIDEYNEWIVEENENVTLTEKFKELSQCSTNTYKKYVDLNEDGTYLGKNND